MVFNLCYEVTGNRHDAEDAVQAAFLSLAVQAKSGQPVQAIGPWLQQVARRMSLDINRSRKRRKSREDKHGKAWETRLTELGGDANGGSGSHGNPASAAGWDEVRQVVQQELGTLPPKYRMPLILHYYGGLSRDEMARELSCRANTLGVRLHRGREMLAKKLARRGVTLSGVILGVLLTEVCRSIVTERLVFSTAQAAVLLSAGHPYACGVVSPQIVALAQRATLALANAKIRFAASLALLAGGAAAAGAQVVSHVGWDFPHSGNWNLGRVVRWFTPKANPMEMRGHDNPASQPGAVAKDSTPTDADHQAKVASARPEIPAGPLPHFIPFRGMNWGNWQIYRPATADNSNAVANRSVTPPANANGNNNPPSNTNTKTNNSRDDFGVARGTAGSGGSGTARSGGDKSPDVARNDNGSRNSPGRGGVKPRSNGIPDPTDGSPNPETHGPGEVVKEFPIPPRLDIKPGPMIGPVNPPPAPADSEHVVPIPAGDVAPHGGFLSDDVLHITTDYNPAGAESFEQILGLELGKANFHLGDGESLVNKEVIVGHLGTGVATQVGGLHTVDSLYLGVIKTGRGLYQLTGGELSVTASPIDPNAAAHTIEIGSAGEGLFLLGNMDSTGRITQTDDGGGVNLTLGAIRSANGTLRGWGTVALTGQLSNNGRIIADGYGQDRSLDLSSFATVTNDFSNRDTKGWYAVNHGRLDLPAIPVAAGTNTYTWGGNADDAKITLVNSARVTLTDVQSNGVLKIALQALDRTDLPTLPQGHHFIGVWSFDARDADGNGLSAAGGMDLLVRYDDALAAQLGLDENVLKLWKYDGQWERLDFDPTFVRDATNHTLSVHTDIGGMSYFAVSAPEPGSVMLLSIGAGLWLGRRRRRNGRGDGGGLLA